jgi:hypothetical protein
MSIFSESFPDFIKNELNERQAQMGNSSKDIKYLTSLMSRTAWVRMTSGVNVLDSKGEYTNEVAKSNVITNVLGGTNKNENGNPFTGYKSEDYLKRKYRHGIRPIPGITDVAIQSLSPNGSLRKVTVKFNVWDIKQLDLMEILYMRPGFTICVEWGWSHKLSTGDIQSLPNFGKNFLDKKEVSLMELYAEAYDEVKKSNGNYDICIGKVQNYSWSARTDGGYDCEVTIVTYGEILESLKCNYIPLDSDLVINGLVLNAVSGSNVLNQESNASSNFSPLNTSVDSGGYNKYSEGILPGLLSDLYNSSIAYNGKVTLTDKTTTPDALVQLFPQYSMYVLTLPPDVTQGTVRLAQQGKSVFITLKSFIKLLNKYVLLHNPKGELLEFSTLYNKSDINSELKCLAHPFSMSTNPNICLIRPDVWLNASSTPPPQSATTPPPSNLNPNNPTSIDYTGIIKELKRLADKKKKGGTSADAAKVSIKKQFDLLLNNQKLTSTTKEIYEQTLSEINNQYLLLFDYFFKPLQGADNTSAAGQSAFVNLNNYEENKKKYGTFYLFAINYIGLFQNTAGNDFDIAKLTTNSYYKPALNNLNNTNIVDIPTGYSKSIQTANTVSTANAKEVQIANNLAVLKDLNPFFVPNTGYSEGYIGNIYLNLDFLYSLVAPKETETNDPNRVNNVYINKYITDILIKVENSIGSINQFEIYSDYTDNIARIIDKNLLVDVPSPFNFQIDNTSSIVRNYGIKSMIFPDQMSIFAISAQTKSGTLGEKNQHLIAYNRGIQDRIIKESNSGANYVSPTKAKPNDTASPIFKALSTLTEYSKIYNQVPPPTQ